MHGLNPAKSEILTLEVIYMNVISKISYFHPPLKTASKLTMLLLLLLFMAFPALQANAVPADSGTITLNLKDADINTLITTVAEFSNKNFVVDPRVKGKVTVISAHPMNKDEIYEVFLSILQVHGYAVIPAGEVEKIVPNIQAKQGSIPTLGQGVFKNSDQMVTQVIPLENVAAAQMVPILRPLIPQQGHLAAYAQTNILVISDTANNVARLMKIIARIDKASDNEIEVIPLQNASASELVRILTALQRKTGAKVGAQAVQLAADQRTNSILISGEKTERLRLRALIGHLDTPLDDTGNTKVVYLRYVKAKDLQPVLRGVTNTLKAKSKIGVPGKLPRQGTQIDIQADENTNALVITAPPEIYRTLRSVINQLDIRRAQVLIEAIIVEISVDKSRELGIQLGIGDSSGGTSVAPAMTNFGTATSLTKLITAASGGTVPALKSGLSVILGQYNKGGESFAALIQALASDTKTNILSTPSLITLDNQEAEIIVGENVPFITGSFASTGAGGGASSVNPFQTIERQDVGLTLKVTPQINEGDAVMLDIQQEVSDVKASSNASDLITTKRSIKTKVMVNDGQVLVLGGLINSRTSQTSSKVPLLGDIPLLGRLFKSDATINNKSNLMVFIRPTILRDAATTGQVSGAKYNYMRTQQLQMQQSGVSLFPDGALTVMPELKQPKTNQPETSNPEPIADMQPEGEEWPF